MTVVGKYVYGREEMKPRKTNQAEQSCFVSQQQRSNSFRYSLAFSIMTNISLSYHFSKRSKYTNNNNNGKNIMIPYYVLGTLLIIPKHVSSRLILSKTQ